MKTGSFIRATTVMRTMPYLFNPQRNLVFLKVVMGFGNSLREKHQQMTIRIHCNKLEIQIYLLSDETKNNVPVTSISSGAKSNN